MWPFSEIRHLKIRLAALRAEKNQAMAQWAAEIAETARLRQEIEELKRKIEGL